MISVIITTYKRELPILKRAIETVMKQTEKDIELIVVNDYPEYDALIRALMKEYPTIRYISHKERQGACKARNDGIAAANGIYIAFLDDDDEWEENKLERQKKVMEETSADFVYCTGRTINDISGEYSSMEFIHECRSDDPVREMLKGNFMGGCSFPLIKKSVLNQLGGFDLDMPASQDYELWLRICKSYKIAYVNESLVIYHVGNEAITTNPERRIKGFSILCEKHQDIFRKYPKEAAIFYKTIVWTAVFTGRKDLLPAAENRMRLHGTEYAKLKVYEIIMTAKMSLKKLIAK